MIFARNSLIPWLMAPMLAAFVLPSDTLAQGRGGGTLSIQPGTMLPKIDAFDEQGEKFNTASLKGSYSVIVFGCLT